MLYSINLAEAPNKTSLQWCPLCPSAHQRGPTYLIFLSPPAGVLERRSSLPDKEEKQVFPLRLELGNAPPLAHIYHRITEIVHNCLAVISQRGN